MGLLETTSNTDITNRGHVHILAAFASKLHYPRPPSLAHVVARKRQEQLVKHLQEHATLASAAAPRRGAVPAVEKHLWIGSEEGGHQAKQHGLSTNHLLLFGRSNLTLGYWYVTS